jgi:4-amino-4-deoxy-L-arabinose transferase-like glycosyltransferase
MTNDSGLTGDRRAVRMAILLGGICLLLLFFWRLGDAPLLEPDEGRYTEVPREMLASGDFITPHLDGVLYFEKPPLHYWLVAAAVKALGLNELAARLPSAVFALLGVLLVYRLGLGMAGRRAGLVAAAALGSSPLYVILGRLATLDMTLSFLLTLTLACFWFAHREDDGRRAALWWHGTFLAAALAVMAKGLIGIVIPGAIVFLYLLATRGWRVLTRVPWVTGLGVFVVVALPWHVLAAVRNPDFLWFYFVHEHFLRYVTPIAERQEPLWFFLAVLALGCVPWSGLFPSTLRLVRWRQIRSSLEDKPEATFLLVWFGFIFVFFSASQSKLIPYILPALPPLAVLVGLLAARLRDAELAPSRLEVGGLVTGGALTAVYGLFFLWAGSGRIDRLGLGGVISPALVIPGALLVVVAAMVALAGVRSIWRRRFLALFAAGCCISAAVASVVPLVGRERSSKTVAERLRGELRAGDLVYSYRCYPESLPVYLARTVGVVANQGELTFGIARLSPSERQRRFPTAQEFRTLWDSERRVFAVAGSDWARRMAADGLTHARLLWQGDASALLSNERPPGKREEGKR